MWQVTTERSWPSPLSTRRERLFDIGCIPDTLLPPPLPLQSRNQAHLIFSMRSSKRPSLAACTLMVSDLEIFLLSSDRDGTPSWFLLPNTGAETSSTNVASPLALTIATAISQRTTLETPTGLQRGVMLLRGGRRAVPRRQIGDGHSDDRTNPVACLSLLCRVQSAAWSCCVARGGSRHKQNSNF